MGIAALLTALSLEKGPVIGVDANPEKLARATELAPRPLLPGRARGETACGRTWSSRPRAPERLRKRRWPRRLPRITVTVDRPPPTRAPPLPRSGSRRRPCTIRGLTGLRRARPGHPAYLQLWREGKLPIEELISSGGTVRDQRELRPARGWPAPCARPLLEDSHPPQPAP
ncbi:hypothetical protein QJS66_03140 [Kocuria rhizophila]|nr:hypothetical protein QJS66_03140 [Kocuria rhizophila]